MRSWCLLVALLVGGVSASGERPQAKMSGEWRLVPGQDVAAAMLTPAMGTTVVIAQRTDAIKIEFSYRRVIELPLDGSEQSRPFYVAESEPFVEVGSARWRGEDIVINTHRTRLGRFTREERALSIRDGVLTIEGRRWVGKDLTASSTLTYRRVEGSD